VASSNVSPAFPSSFHKPFSCQASLLSFGPHQEIPHGHQTPPNHNALYAVDKDIFQAIMTNKMATENFLYANLHMHHSHQQRCHKSNHNQASMAQPPVWLGHHTDRVELEHGDMVNHQSPKITIALGHPANGF
jgi:hypothetical protein